MGIDRLSCDEVSQCKRVWGHIVSAKFGYSSITFFSHKQEGLQSIFLQPLFSFFGNCAQVHISHPSTSLLPEEWRKRNALIHLGPGRELKDWDGPTSRKANLCLRTRKTCVFHQGRNQYWGEREST